MTVAAILLAGGSGSRLRHPENKVFVPIRGRPLIAWSVRTFLDAPSIDHLVIVVRDGEDERVAAILDDEGVDVPVRLATGGDIRHASEQAGLDVIADEIAGGGIDVVLIHDTARPFVGRDLVEHVARTAAMVGGAIPTLAVGDGVYRLNGDGVIELQPGDLHRAQTPQGFRARPLLDAYRQAARDGFTGVDTAETVERYTDLEVAVVAGEATNIKVTFVDDLQAAERIAALQAP